MLHWSLVRLAHCLLVIALNDVYYFEQINMMMMMILESNRAMFESNLRCDSNSD